MRVSKTYFFATLIAALCAAHVEAQQYPAKPVRVIVPYAPGGGVDIMGRLAAQKYSERLGTQFIVENRAGGGTIIGTEAVARAAPDGYTLLFANPALPARAPRSMRSFRSTPCRASRP